MNIAIRILAGIAVLASVACGGGSSGGSAGPAPVQGIGFAADGNYAGIDTFVTNIRVVDLGSNTPPVDDDCRGDISIVVDANAADVITGNGNCTTTRNNAASYSIVGGFPNGDVDFEGQITIVFSGVTHVLPFSGSRNGDRLEANFAGRTPQVRNIVIDWNGSFTADR